MRAIVNTAPGVLEMRDLPRPEPGEGEVRIRTAACCVCATDLAMIAGWERTGFPSVPGHEWSGTVDAAGPGVDASLVGELCVAENVLLDGGEVGFEHPGGYGEFFITRASNLRKIAAQVPPEVAALAEPTAVCVRGLSRLKMTDPSGAIIFGDGPVGLITLALLGRQKVEEIALVGGRDVRLELAVRLGATGTCNYHGLGIGIAEGLASRFSRTWPNVIEASGSAAALEAAIEIASPGGKILVLGDYGEDTASFRWNRVLHRELEIIGSNASAGAWDEAARIVSSGEMPLGEIITHRFSANDFAQAVETARSSRDAVKVVMLW